MHPALSNQVFVLAQLEEVHILVPEVCIGALVLIAGHLVEDAEVRHDLHRIKLLTNLLKKLLLLVRQLIVVHLVVSTHIQRITIIVNCPGQLVDYLIPTLRCLIFGDHVVQLVLLEGLD